MIPLGERRSHPRYPTSRHGIRVSAKLRAGAVVEVLDVSADGLLIESHTRLAPGAIVDLVLGGGHAPIALRGVIVHSRVSAIRRRSGISYRAGVRAPLGTYYPLPPAAAEQGNLLPRQSDCVRPSASATADAI